VTHRQEERREERGERRQQLRRAAAAELARQESRGEDRRGAGDRRQEAKRLERVAEDCAPDPEDPDRERRVVDVAEREVIRAGQIVELVAEDPVAARGREVEREPQRCERA
jgi:hypothetical protein